MPKKPNRKKELIKELNTLWKQKCYEVYGDKCLLCGNRAVYHHYIMKSKNGLYKYDIKNGIPLCQSHHSIIHGITKNPLTTHKIVEQIREIKGKEWCEWVDKSEKTFGTSFNTISWLEGQKEILENT